MGFLFSLVNLYSKEALINPTRRLKPHQTHVLTPPLRAGLTSLPHGKSWLQPDLPHRVSERLAERLARFEVFLQPHQFLSTTFPPAGAAHVLSGFSQDLFSKEALEADTVSP